MAYDRDMRQLGEFPTEPRIYFFHNKQGRTLYVGKANNLRARLAQHENQYEIVGSWLSFFDQYFETLNLRLREAVEHMDSISFNRIGGIIAWPLSIVQSTQAIDCCYDTVDSIKSDPCSPGELDRKEIMYVRSLKPPFNHQYNNDLAGSERWKYYPARYLKSKALSTLLSHYTRRFAFQTPKEP